MARARFTTGGIFPRGPDVQGKGRMRDVPIMDLVAGTRPNLVKIAALLHALAPVQELEARIVFTGQHTHHGMCDAMLQELSIPRPHVRLGIAARDRPARMEAMMQAYGALLDEHPPRATVVTGDVDSTVACALCAFQRSVPVVHVEAGLRSFDRSMPEETNRILTDAVSDLLLVSEPSGVQNLKREGVEAGRVALVGNVMIDTLRRHLEQARRQMIPRRFGLSEGRYAYVTLHRPGNVDDPEVLERFLRCFSELSGRMPLIFSVHPRTARAMREACLERVLEDSPGVCAVQPLSYVQNLGLMASAGVVLTDSGGIQEETSVLGVPCITLRRSTERPITLTHGTNVLAAGHPGGVAEAFQRAACGPRPSPARIPGWDGRAASRAVDLIRTMVCG